MKIAHVVKSESSHSDDEKYALNLAAAQQAHGSHAMVVVNASGSFSRACLEQGLPVAVVQDLARRQITELPHENEIQDLVEQLRSFGAEIIHCHHPGVMMQSVFAAKRCHVPCVLTLQLEPALIYRLLDMAKQWDIYPAALSLSRRDVDALRKRGVPETRIHYVPGGTSPMPPGRPSGRRGPHRPGLVLVDALTFRKGVEVAILAVAELRKRLGSGSPELDIYGAGKYGPYYREIVPALGLDDIIRFHRPRAGALERSAADILLMTSREETGPLVVLEAMSLGMPAVATDVGDVAQMLPDPRYGRIIPVNSIRALADAVESLLADMAAGEFDPGLLIERHRSFYTAEKMTEAVGQVYRQLLREVPA